MSIRDKRYLWLCESYLRWTTITWFLTWFSIKNFSKNLYQIRGKYQWKIIQMAVKFSRQEFRTMAVIMAKENKATIVIIIQWKVGQKEEEKESRNFK